MQIDDCLIINIDSNLKENDDETDYNFTFNFDYYDQFQLEKSRKYVAIKKISIPKTYYQITNQNNKLTFIINGTSYFMQIKQGNYQQDFWFVDVMQQLNAFLLPYNVQFKKFQMHDENYDTGHAFYQLDDQFSVHQIQLLIEDNFSILNRPFGMHWNTPLTINTTGIVTPLQIDLMPENNILILSNLVNNQYEIKKTYELPILQTIYSSQFPPHSIIYQEFDPVVYKKELNQQVFSSCQLKIKIVSIQGIYFDIVGDVQIEIVLFNMNFPQRQYFDLFKDLIILFQNSQQDKKNQKKQQEVKKQLQEIEFQYQINNYGSEKE